jgi:hypothetical protein
MAEVSITNEDEVQHKLNAVWALLTDSLKSLSSLSVKLKQYVADYKKFLKWVTCTHFSIFRISWLNPAVFRLSVFFYYFRLRIGWTLQICFI